MNLFFFQSAILFVGASLQFACCYALLDQAPEGIFEINKHSTLRIYNMNIYTRIYMRIKKDFVFVLINKREKLTEHFRASNSLCLFYSSCNSLRRTLRVRRIIR